MRKILFTTAVTLAIIACGNSKSATIPTTENTPTVSAPQPSVAPSVPQVEEEIVNAKDSNVALAIEWLDFETAIDRNQDNPKYIFIDVYTDWCGWCKRMDASTFVDPKVVKFINQNCYAVKMDAEMKEAIAFNGKLYEYKQFTPKAGYNTLAVSLLDSKMSFPSFVILDKKEAKRGKIMGYKTPETFLVALQNYVK